MEKEGTHELARDILDRTEEVLGVRKMLLNKKEAERVTGRSRRQTERVFRTDKQLTHVDIARRMSASK